MKLSEYPQAIANLQTQLLHIQQRLRIARETAAFALSHIDREIAFDRELKNDNQRKARRNELMETDPDFIKASQEAQKLADRQAELEIELELARNQFSVQKLEHRGAIAKLESQSHLAA